METTVTVSELNSSSQFLISRFTRQTYIDAIPTLDETVKALVQPQVSLVNAFNSTAILSPSIDKQIIVVNITAAGTVRVRKPTNDCKEFTLVMKTPANISVNAFPSGTIMPQIAVAQTIHSIRFIWDAVNNRWRSVRTR